MKRFRHSLSQIVQVGCMRLWTHTNNINNIPVKWWNCGRIHISNITVFRNRHTNLWNCWNVRLNCIRNDNCESSSMFIMFKNTTNRYFNKTVFDEITKLCLYLKSGNGINYVLSNIPLLVVIPLHLEWSSEFSTYTFMSVSPAWVFSSEIYKQNS